MQAALQHAIATARTQPMWIIAALVGSLLGFLLFKDFLARFPLRHVPTPPGIPLIGHVHHLLKKPWIAFAKFADQYGKVYVLRLWSRPFMVLSDPDLIRQVCKDQKHKYVKDQWSYEFFRDILGYGLVTSEGAKWKAHRKLLSPAFHFAALERLHAVFDAAAGRLTANLLAGCAAKPAASKAAVLESAAAGSSATGLTRSDATTVPLGEGAALMELSSHFRRVTLEVISQIAVGYNPEQANVFPALFEAVLDELNQRPYKPWRAFLPHIEVPHRRRLAQMNAIVGEMIASRRAAKASSTAGTGATTPVPAAAAAATSSSDAAGADGNDISAAGDEGAGMSVNGRAIFDGGKGDMLDMMLESGVELSDKQISDELKTQLFAGHETSSMLLTWACYLLAQYPQVYRKAQAEVDEVLGLPGRSAAPTFEQFRGLVYLEWVLKEAMRVYTPVPILNRECVEADTLDGHPVVPGTGIVMSVWALHNSAALWGEDVAQFRPERFSPEETKGRHPWSYMPFSQGERNCIGQNLAMMEAKVVLGSLLRNFALSLPVGQARPQTDSFIIPVRPHDRLNMIVERR